MKKKLLVLIILLFNIVNVNASYTPSSTWTDKTSPYFFVWSQQKNFWNFPSIINPLNMPPSAFSWCNVITNPTTFKKYHIPYGVTWMDCNTSNRTPLSFKPLLDGLKQANIANIVWFHGQLFSDANISRYYVVKVPINSIDSTKLKRDSHTWDIWYVDDNLNTNNWFTIFDPDLNNITNPSWDGLETSSQFGNNNDNEVPSMAVSLFSLDGARLSENLLNKGVYTMEHFLWKKYQSDNAYLWAYQTTTYDSFKLYNMTYYNENSLPTLDYYKYCNWDLYNTTTTNIRDLLIQSNSKSYLPFQNKASTIKAWRAWFCWGWTSWLRVNTNHFAPNVMSQNGSIKVQYWFYNWNQVFTNNAWQTSWPVTPSDPILNSINPIEEKVNSLTTKSTSTSVANDTYSAILNPQIWNNEIAYIKLPHVWIIWNEKMLLWTDYKTFYQWKKGYVYYVVKISLVNRDYYSPTKNKIISNTYNQSIDPYLDWFDPIDNGWYSDWNHIQTTDGTFSPHDKWTEEYKQFYSKFWNYNWTWQGNMYIPFTVNASMYNMSSPWYVVDNTTYWWDSTEDNNLKKRSYDLPLTAAQWYIQTETWNNSWSKSWQAFSITSSANLGVWKLINNKFLFLRNFDADSSISGNYFDNNLTAKMYIKSKTTNNWFQDIYDKGSTYSSIYWLPWFSSKWIAVKANDTWWKCGWIYNIDWNKTWAVVASWSEGVNSAAAMCGWTNISATRLSWNSADTTQIITGGQQWFEWTIDTTNLSGDVNFALTTIFENVNDLKDSGAKNYNMINTTSNYLENIPADNINCEINASKLLVNDTTTYTWQYNSNANLWADTNYTNLTWDNTPPTNTTKNIFDDIIKKSTTNVNWLLMYQYHFDRLSLTDYATLHKFYPSGSTTDKEKWLLWEKWLITYNCSWLPSGHTYSIIVSNWPYKYVDDYSQNASDVSLWINYTWTKFSHTKAIITILSDLSLWYDNSWNLDATKKSYNWIHNHVNYNWNDSTILFNRYDPTIDTTTLKNIWFSSDNIIASSSPLLSNWAIWWVWFKVDNTTDWGYWLVNAMLRDETTWNIVASKKIYIQSKKNTKTLEYNDAVKNEQKLTNGYPSSSIWFDWTTYWVSFSFLNTTNLNASTQPWRPAWWTNAILLWGYTQWNSMGTSFPLFADIKDSCLANTDYVCDDWTRAQQNTAKLYQLIANSGTIKIIENTGWTITTKTAISWNSPVAWKYVYKYWSWLLIIYMPSDANYFKWNTIYKVQLSVPKWVFAWSWLWEWLTWTNKDAVMIVPSLIYTQWGSTTPWDVGKTTFVSNKLVDNLYYKPNITTPSSNACLQELTTWTNALYKSWGWFNVYLSEAWAANNGKSCSDANVKCLLSFRWVATNANLFNSSSSPYSWMSELNNWAMSIWNKYSLLVETVANGNDSSTTSHDATETHIIQNPLEMSTKFSFDANFNPSKWLSLERKTRFANYPMVMTQNTSMLSKIFTSLDTVGAKYYVYDTWLSSWQMWDIENTRPFADWLKYTNTNLYTVQNKTPTLINRDTNSELASARRYYTWIYWTVTWDKKPSANLAVTFWNVNVPTVLQWQTCNFPVTDFPTVQTCSVSWPTISNFNMGTWNVDNYNSNDINNFMSDDSSMMNNINSCGQWNWTSNAFSIDRSNYVYSGWNPSSWLIINFNINNNSSCWAWDYSVANWNAVKVRVNIDNLSSDFKKCIATSWTTTTYRWSNYLEIRDLEIKAWNSLNVQVKCAFSDRDPSCWTPSNKVSVDTSNSVWTDSYWTSQFKKCVLPTLKLKRDAIVNDWNSANDKTSEIYSTAYPFEFAQCNEKVRQSWTLDYKWGCWITDNWYKDFKLIWNPWTNIDDLWSWRQFVKSLSWNSIRWVSPNKVWNSVVWDFNSWTLSNILGNSLNAQVNITPINWDAIRFENSNFTLQVNRTDIIKVEVDPSTSNTWSWSTYNSRNLSSAIWYDPVVTNEKMYDNWLYTNPDYQHVIMHKEEIDTTSKKLTKWGDDYKEDVIYETNVANPSWNTMYWLWDLKFTLDLKSKKNLFDSVDTTKTNIWTSIWVSWGSGKWSNQTLAPWTNKSYKWYFKLDPTLHSTADPDFNVIWNTLSWWTWKPALTFSNWVSCAYNEWFKTWNIAIIDNPIVVNALAVKDNSPTPDWWNQHLPWDILNFQIDIKNTNVDKNFNNWFVELDLDENLWITDTNLHITDLWDIFEFVGGPTWTTDPYYNTQLFDINGWDQSCWFKWTKIICLINNAIPSNSTYTFNLNMLIKVKSWFYDFLKASTVDEKYWYPIQINEIRYWTSDLNLVTHATDWNIVYYSSDLNNIPSWDRWWDVLINDINDPANRIVSVAPDDGLYNFYIGMPYMDINTRVINTAIWHFSPWDILEFKTKIESKSKSYIRDPLLIQKLFRDTLMNFVDVEVLKVDYTASKTNFNTLNKIVDIHARNTDTDPTNDITWTNMVDIQLKNNIAWTQDISVNSNKMTIWSDGPVASYFEWVADPSTWVWGTVDLTTRVKIVKLKKIKKPQIWCGISDVLGCVRWVDDWTNPKPDYNVWILDLDSVWTNIDEKDEEKYFVYFPILKSILFQQQNDSYIPTPWSNDIKWIINDPNTEVVYRVDNFIPSAYDATNTWIWKARDPMSFIRLPVWVKYTPNSAVVVQNLSDSAPYWTDVVIWDPIVTSKTDYVQNVATWVSTYQWDINNTTPNWNLLPTPDDIINEQNAQCLYWDWLYWFCILGL